METYLRVIILRFGYKSGFAALCRDLTDSLSWRRFCRIPLGEPVPHPSTLEKITVRCGAGCVDELNEAPPERNKFEISRNWQQLIQSQKIGRPMIAVGLILLLIGFLLGVPVLWTLGIVVLIVGGVLALLGVAGRPVGGRAHYW
jgi:hypothetical protein